MRLISLLVMCTVAHAAAPPRSPDAERGPHPVVLTFHVTGLSGSADVDAITTSVKKVKTVTSVALKPAQGLAIVNFDSHKVSYHEIAQAIADAGQITNKKYDPSLNVQVVEYPQGDNAAKVDAIFSAKRLNDRVRVEALDKSQGRFVVHFKTLEIDPKASSPQGFNGGHLNHPIHDPPPRGLGLTFIYEAASQSIPNETGDSDVMFWMSDIYFVKDALHLFPG